MSKKNSDKLHKKFKITNIILAISAALCVIALIVPMGIPVKADVDDSKKAENSKTDVANEENIDYAYIHELLRNGKWAAELTKDELDDTDRGPGHEETVEYWTEWHIYKNGDVCIQEFAVVVHIDTKDNNKKIRIKYTRLSDANTRGDTILVRSIKEKMADVKNV